LITHSLGDCGYVVAHGQPKSSTSPREVWPCARPVAADFSICPKPFESAQANSRLKNLLPQVERQN